MLNLIIIGMLIILIFIFSKAKHFKHKTYWMLIVVFILFFYISASQVIKNADLNLGTFEGIMGAGKLYFNWLIHLGGNAKALGAQAIKMDWVGNVTGK